LLDIFKRNIDVTNLSNFKTKAKAKYYFEINNKDDLSKLADIFKYIEENKIEYLFV